MGKLKKWWNNRTCWQKGAILVLTIIMNLLILIASVNADFPDGTPGGFCNWDSDCSYHPKSMYPFVYPCHDYKFKCIKNICQFVCPGDTIYEEPIDVIVIYPNLYIEEESDSKIVTIEKEPIEISETPSIEKNLSSLKIQEESQPTKEDTLNKSNIYTPSEILDNKTTNEPQPTEPTLNSSFERIISLFKKILSWFG